MKKYFWIVILWCLSSCHSIDKGLIFNKWVEPQHIENIQMTAGKITTLVPVVIPEQYWVSIASGEKTSDFTMGKKDWDHYSIGDYISFK
jgi:hypothetical protein